MDGSPLDDERRVSGLGRTRLVLESFTAARPQQTLTEISKRTKLPMTTVHRLVRGLAEWGLLERDAEGNYEIGLKMWEIGSLARRTFNLREAANPFLQDLYEMTHQVVQLAVLDGTEAVYLERISSRGAVLVRTRRGGRFPLHATGVGLVLLAHAPAELREEVLAGPLRRYTPKTIADPERLRETLALVRKQDYAVSDGQIDLFSLSVAAPIRDARENVVAAISVAVPADSANPQALAVAVRAAARGTSRVLGHSATRAGAR